MVCKLARVLVLEYSFSSCATRLKRTCANIIRSHCPIFSSFVFERSFTKVAEFWLDSSYRTAFHFFLSNLCKLTSKHVLDRRITRSFEFEMHRMRLVFPADRLKRESPIVITWRVKNPLDPATAVSSRYHQPRNILPFDRRRDDALFSAAPQPPVLFNTRCFQPSLRPDISRIHGHAHVSRPREEVLFSDCEFSERRLINSPWNR